jgi:hypothetical protein
MSKSKSQTTKRRAGAKAPRASGAAAASPPDAAAAATLTYVYAAVAGRPRDSAVARLPTLPGATAPRIVSIDPRLSVIVADVPADVYNREALDERLSDLDWVGACGAAHHAVADALFDAHLVVPFRLFTLFSSESSAVTALRARRSRIAASFARLKGRHEFVLRIGRPDPSRRVAPGPAADPARSTRSGTGFLQAKASSRREASERNQRVSESAAAVFEELQAVADDASARAAPPGTNLLLDAAFLVSARKAAAFRRTLGRTAAGLLDDGCAVSLTGPWPPYSFASTD